MMDPDVVISIRDLVKTFPDREGRDVKVLDGVSFDIRRGETLVIMGGSGCGKSTLLNCLIGEYRINGGSTLYRTSDMDAPVDIAGLTDADLDRVRLRFGILFQSGALFNSLSVAENVALPLREHTSVDPSVIDIIVTLKLQQVKMLPHRDKMPSQLSGGQKKRAGLARATALDPEILFYDEPSAGLDPVTSAAIDELMIDFSRKLSVTSIVVTHEMDSAFRIADRMVMLEKGRVLRIGTRQEFESLRDADPATLSTDEDRLLNQFLNGASSGPLTDRDGLSMFEKLLIEG
ncbi:MAG: ATP-binding cassette domain-containing protein [Phycisphaerae bacterium]|nr:MAG: ATP-binding cassette domain-containing protein [Planctomycetota bacterium]KAB2948183.1 MAG: ATP-binding cassette domain-containing protein [Phycisphaerae bacterium]MBE7458492.1 ATP-binding cassette domain-containing protein [Planctomycetia bacterium]MCK6465884.1 ATP-binding cassette domain-containing protein [Phycisphaerae bacterium]MCL4719572.1 ATP-binding cassette domain-containing protein [Phycisphaerae bacterium]